MLHLPGSIPRPSSRPRDNSTSPSERQVFSDLSTLDAPLRATVPAPQLNSSLRWPRTLQTYNPRSIRHQQRHRTWSGGPSISNFKGRGRCLRSIACSPVGFGSFLIQQSSRCLRLGIHPRFRWPGVFGLWCVWVVERPVEHPYNFRLSRSVVLRT
jgi:hypothetical protein